MQHRHRGGDQNAARALSGHAHRRRRTWPQACGGGQPQRQDRRDGHRSDPRRRKVFAAAREISSASDAEFLLQGCPGLVEQIERGEFDSAATDAMLEKYILPLLERGADTLVLGCTHYPFVRASIERIVAAGTERDVVLVDTGDAVARQLARLLATAGTLNQGDGQKSQLQAFTTASATALSVAFSGLLGLDQQVSEVEIASTSIIPAPL